MVRERERDEASAFNGMRIIYGIGICQTTVIETVNRIYTKT